MAKEKARLVGEDESEASQVTAVIRQKEIRQEHNQMNELKPVALVLPSHKPMLEDEALNQPEPHEEALKAKNAEIEILKVKLRKQEDLKDQVKVLKHAVNFKDEQMDKLIREFNNLEVEKDWFEGLAKELVEQSEENARTIKDLKRKSEHDSATIEELNERLANQKLYGMHLTEYVQLALDSHEHTTEAYTNTQLRLKVTEAALIESRNSEERLNAQLILRTLERNIFENLVNQREMGTQYRSSEVLAETQQRLKLAETELEESRVFREKLVYDLGYREAERDMFKIGFQDSNRKLKNKELELMNMAEKVQKLEEQLKEAKDMLEENRQNDVFERLFD